MSETEAIRTLGVSAARVGLVAGGLMSLVVTPPLATAYYFAYGRGEGESPAPDWLSGIGWPTWFDGSDAVSTYNSYGVVFGFAVLVVAVSLGVVVVGRSGKRRLERRAWWMIVGGLGAVALGSISEYGIPEDLFDSSNGFFLSLLGFLIIAAGTLVLGWALHRETDVGAFAAAGVALVGPVSIVAGTAIIEHLPSGPASLLMVTAIAIGAVGLPDTPRT